MGFIKKNIWALVLVAFIISFFWQVFIKGLLPVPADTIVGLYHPFIDFYVEEYPRGIPFQNFLITDPIRQIIPWKVLVVDSLASFSLPLWNPYEMAGKPLLANFQSGTLYPLNLLLFIKPFEFSWSIFIILQPILAAVFMFLFLRNLKLDIRAAVLGSASFALGGFSIVWLEWGNIVHTALWLPLILLSIDKVIKIKKTVSSWSIIFLFSLTCSFFAGHLQIFFYIFLLSIAYIILRWFENGKAMKSLTPFAVSYVLFALVSLPQSLPTLQFINLSSRSLDQNVLTSAGWFIPWQNLIQFIAPDFFGNPATLNYWGVWNYAEFAGYIGIIGIFFALLSFFIKKQNEIYFFSGVILISLIFALPNPISNIPFTLSIPFISSAQPTRLIFLVFVSLCILAAYGFNAFLLRKISLRILAASGVILIAIFLTGWLIVLGIIDLNIKPEDLLVAKRNLMLPTLIFILGFIICMGIMMMKKELTRNILIVAIIALSFFDLFRFGSKFTPFTNPSYFYPKTSIIEFLQNQKGLFRIATTDSRILAPNISTYYKIQSIEGYDPLYLNSYAKLIAASEREDHSIKPPFGFNRIITPKNMSSPIIDLLNVKYVLSIRDLPKEEFKEVFREGQTKVYENLNFLPRAFFVEKTIPSVSEEVDIQKLFQIDLRKEAIVSITMQELQYSSGSARILSYEPNRVVIETEVIKSNINGNGFLVVSDTDYPTWEAYVDGKFTFTHRADFGFRGISVPEGKHIVEFRNSLLLNYLPL